LPSRYSRIRRAVCAADLPAPPRGVTRILIPPPIRGVGGREKCSAGCPPGNLQSCIPKADRDIPKRQQGDVGPERPENGSEVHRWNRGVSRSDGLVRTVGGHSSPVAALGPRWGRWRARSPPGIAAPAVAPTGARTVRPPVPPPRPLPVALPQRRGTRARACGETRGGPPAVGRRLGSGSSERC